MNRIYMIIFACVVIQFDCHLMAQSPIIDAQLQKLPNVNDATQLFVKSIDVRDGEGWAVGYYRVPINMNDFETRSLAYRYQNDQWAIFPTPNPASNTGVVNVQTESVAIGTGSESAVIAGLYIANGFQSPDTLMLEFGGDSWQHVITPGQSMFGAQGFLFETVHIDVGGTIYMGGQFANPAAGRPTATLIVGQENETSFDRYDGQLISNSAHRFRDIDSVGESEIWLVGAAGGTAVAVGRSYAATFDGNSLNENSPPNISFGENLVAVAAISSDDVWAAGVYQDIENNLVVTIPLFWHWDGSSWQQFESPAFATDLVAFGSNNIFGVGNDKLIHWDGSEWSVVHQFDEPLMALRSLAIKSTTELVAVGENPFGEEPFVVNYSLTSLGDVNQDGQVDLLDVHPFVNLIANGDYQEEADINGDGVVNLVDVMPFVGLLAG